MINLKKNILIISIIIFIFIIFIPNLNDAKEILIYADKITYDEDKNIIASGNAKIFKENQFINSDLIIYNEKNKRIILPTEFVLKDDRNNFLSGSNGYFEQNLTYGEFDNVKIKLNDGSRIIGEKGKRDGHVDIISKAVYTPCISRIKIGNFICPTWQLEAEKILHDNKNLFLYQKHSKMRVINTPVYYLPYMVTPSPLRKERKSGFLTPSLNFNFFDSKTSQSTSFPYYFNLSEDKELTFTPIFNYGGGVDSSQRFNFDYNQIISGGYFSSDLIFDSNFENQNNNKWFSDASLITKYKKNINSNYRVSIDSALQTSKNYIQITQPNNDLSYTNSLSNKINLEGFNLKKIDDYLLINSGFYLTNQENEDNKTNPTVLPNIKYYSGNSKINNHNISSTYEIYNIFRDTNTDIHSENQQKFSYKINTSNLNYKLNSKINLETETYTQIFNTKNKLMDTDSFHTGSFARLFPILGVSIESPFKFKKNNYNFTYKPRTQLIISPGMSNSNKISNEDSSNNSFVIGNVMSLNRYSGSDKLDNSKRISYGFDIYNEKIKLNLLQTYEFTNNSNFHREQGNDKRLSDLLGSFDFQDKKSFNYNFRYDVNDNYLKSQNINFISPTIIGDLNLSYLDEKTKTDNSITQDTETLNYRLNSKKFKKFSKIYLSGLYDLKKEINSEYSIGYTYFDECFGINLDFNRKSYEEDNLKPQDILTLMFSFKNIGSYKSSNLAVSETDKQDIRWETGDSNENLFEIID